MGNASRMTSYQRREQLIEVGRDLFASKGFEAVSVEEIAASAHVSKPIVYEHFGGKEGLYAVVVDREMQKLTEALVSALSEDTAHPRQIVERAALALLTYIEQNAHGFQVLVRDSPSTDPNSSFSSLLGDISLRVEDILVEWFKRKKLPTKAAPYYAQMLIGMTVFTGQYWADQRKVSKEQLAALIVNLAWRGLSRMEVSPELKFEGEHSDDYLATLEANAQHNDKKRSKHAERTDGIEVIVAAESTDARNSTNNATGSADTDVTAEVTDDHATSSADQSSEEIANNSNENAASDKATSDTTNNASEAATEPDKAQLKAQAKAEKERRKAEAKAEKERRKAEAKAEKEARKQQNAADKAADKANEKASAESDDIAAEKSDEKTEETDK